MSKLEAIDTRLAKHEEMMAEINGKLRATEGQITTLKEQLSDQENTIRTIAKEVKQLHDKGVDSENRSRRNNLVFFGVSDSESETWEQSELLLKNICKENLNLELQSVERVHRIGRYNVSKNRPIIVNFASYKEKSRVLSEAKKFKGTTYSVEQDYAPETRHIRKRLWEYVKTNNMNEKHRARLNFDKLIVDGKTYRWDKEKEEVVQIVKK